MFAMGKLFSKRASVPQTGAAPVLIEPLEFRTLLSATVSTVMHTNLVVKADTVSAETSDTDIEGYTPSQIATAYDFSGITFDNGTVAGNGAGQTIAIVDAYNDPSIASDLAVFDSEFNLAAPPSLSVVNQTGGSKLPSNDADWDAEISLDVEWAHATAPDANLLLVEANSDDTTDLMDAVNYARSATGVSVVSISWGGSEFFSWGGGESDSQTNYDPILTTPAGHQGVTFVVAAGDSGTQEGVQWPASSPTVLSVGGTTLYTADDSGTYDIESGWSGTSGGYSVVESEPAYQDAVQDDGMRSVPDVAYDADPNTGFAVYDSVADDGYVGWQEVGGTSAGAPQWAGLLAIVNQGRVLAGDGTLDGATQTLPDLYDLYSAYGSSAYSTYTDYFNDVSSGGGSGTHFRWGGFGGGGTSATPGYDLITGLGTPKGAALISALVGSTATSGGTGSTGTGSTGTGGTGSTGSTGGTTTPTPTLAASPVSVTIDSAPPDSVMGGKAGSVLLALTNTSGGVFDGTVSITLYASASQTISADDTPLLTTTLRVALRPGAVKLIKPKFIYSSSLADGNYYITASLTAVGTDTATSTSASATQVTVTQPFADLASTFASGATISVDPGANDTALVTIENVGNVTATGKFSVTLYASNDMSLDSSDQSLATWNSPRLSLRAGKSVTLKMKFVAPDAYPGSYYLLAGLTSSVTPADTDSSNDLAVALAV